MKTLDTDGTIRQAEEAQMAIDGLTGKLDSGTSARFGKERMTPQWGRTCAIAESVGDELSVGPLSPACVDLRGTLKRTIGLEKNCDSGKIQKWKMYHFGVTGGVGMGIAGETQTMPSRPRMEVLAGSLRIEAYLGDGQALEYTEGENARTAHGIMSICHDVLTAHRERDYRALGVILLHPIWKYLAIEVTATEIQNDADVCFQVYATCPAVDGSTISW